MRLMWNEGKSVYGCKMDWKSSHQTVMMKLSTMWNISTMWIHSVFMTRWKVGQPSSCKHSSNDLLHWFCLEDQWLPYAQVLHIMNVKNSCLIWMIQWNVYGDHSITMSAILFIVGHHVILISYLKMTSIHIITKHMTPLIIASGYIASQHSL